MVRYFPIQRLPEFIDTHTHTHTHYRHRYLCNAKSIRPPNPKHARNLTGRRFFTGSMQDYNSGAECFPGRIRTQSRRDSATSNFVLDFGTWSRSSANCDDHNNCFRFCCEQMTRRLLCGEDGSLYQHRLPFVFVQAFAFSFVQPVHRSRLRHRISCVKSMNQKVGRYFVCSMFSRFLRI